MSASLHHPQTAIVVRCLPAANLGGGGNVRGPHVVSAPIARRGDTKQFTRLLHRGSERTARIMPVQNYSRRFKAPGSLVHGTARVFACRQVSRVSFEGIQVVSPVRVAHVEQSERRDVHEAGNITQSRGYFTQGGFGV